MLALIVWLGGEIFFPVVAAVTFGQLAPNTHAAGQIVGALLRILHTMGMAAGLVALALMALAPAWGIYKARAILAGMILVVLMIGLTAYSQYVIIPTMEHDRMAAGGVIDAVPADSSARIDFNRLHERSTYVEEAVLLMGIAVVSIVASAETKASRAA
uniref:TMEM205-like domain-containing protein n=1 Tax=mine drainage metagenome TaxID=410659 RepID=E6QIC5_9ZZZZ